MSEPRQNFNMKSLKDHWTPKIGTMTVLPYAWVKFTWEREMVEKCVMHLNFTLIRFNLLIYNFVYEKCILKDLVW